MQDVKLYGRSYESDSGETRKNKITPRGGWCIGNGQVAQLYMSEKCLCLNCMHDQMIVMVERSEKKTRRRNNMPCNTTGGGQKSCMTNVRQ